MPTNLLMKICIYMNHTIYPKLKEDWGPMLYSGLHLRDIKILTHNASGTRV